MVKRLVIANPPLGFAPEVLEGTVRACPGNFAMQPRRPAHRRGEDIPPIHGKWREAAHEQRVAHIGEGRCRDGRPG